MALELKNFPPEILEHITSYLTGFIIMRRLQFCGDKMLWARLHAGGVKSLLMGPNVARLSYVLTALTFKNLREFVIRFIGVTRPDFGDWNVFLDGLPSTLVKLEILMDGAENVWLRKMTETEAKDPRNLVFQNEGYMPMNMAERFPLLRHLHLRGTVYSVRIGGVDVIWSQPMYLLFWRLLPRNLDYLHIDHLYWCSHNFLDLLPPHLTSLSHSKTSKMQNELMLNFPTSLLESLRSCHLLLSSSTPLPVGGSTINGEYASPPTLQFPMHLRRMHWQGPMAWLKDASASALRSLTIQFSYMHSTNSNAYQLEPEIFPYLTKLKILSLSRLSDETPYPPNLTSLTIYTNASWRTFAKLPSRLTAFNLRVDGANREQPWLTFPPQLRDLTVRYAHPWKPEVWAALPRSLIHLHSDRSGIEMADIDSQHLPRTLETLAIDGGSSASVLGPVFFEGLGPNLKKVTLGSRTLCDYHLALFPSSVTQIDLARLKWTGRLVAPGETKVVVPECVRVQRLPGSAGFALKDFSRCTEDFGLRRTYITTKITTLPRSVTKLKLCGTHDDCAFEGRVDLPNLRSLHLSRASQWELSTHMPRLGSLVNLKKLAISSKGSLRIADLGIPPCLQTFRVSFWEPKWCPVLPHSLTEFSCSSIELVCVRPLFQLKTLSLGQSVAATMITNFPKSLTKLSCNSWYLNTYPISIALDHLPRLLEIRSANNASDSQLEAGFARGMTQITLHNAQLSVENPAALFEHPWQPLEDGDSKCHLQTFVAQQLQKRFPKLVLQQLKSYSLAFSASKTLFATLPQTLTTLILGNAKLHAKFGKHLPPTLTHLDASTVEGLDHTTARHLPRSLLTLHIKGYGFSPLSLSYIPKSVTQLRLTSMKKFWPHYARALPENLLSLRLQTILISNATIAALPRGLTHLDLSGGAYTLSPPALRQLPPGIRALSGNFEKYTVVGLAAAFPPSLCAFSSGRGSHIIEEKFKEIQTHSKTEQLVSHILTPANAMN